MIKRPALSVLTLASASALFACSPADNDPGPGGVTVGEAKQLDDAAAMLDEKRIDVTAPVQDAEKPQPSDDVR